MEGGGYSSTGGGFSSGPSIHLSNIGKYESIDEIATIANAGLFTTFLAIVSARIGELGGVSLNTYFELFGLEGIVSCVALIGILFQIARYFYTTLYATYERAWSPFIFICFLVGTQVVSDLAFYYGVVNVLKEKQNYMVDIIRKYIGENKWGALGGHSVFMVLTALVAMILNESSDLSKIVLFGVVAFLIPYAISIRYMKPAPPPPPKPKEETIRDARGFY
jgi:hypothetical protein